MQTTLTTKSTKKIHFAFHHIDRSVARATPPLLGVVPVKCSPDRGAVTIETEGLTDATDY